MAEDPDSNVDRYQKTVELRHRRPRLDPGPWVLIYASFPGQGGSGLVRSRAL